MESGNGRRWAILQHLVLLPDFILQQFRLIHLWKKNLLSERSWPPNAFTHFIDNFIHQRNVNRNFFRAIFVHQCKRYPFLLSGLKGNNDFSHCSFIKNLPPPLCPLSHTAIKFMYIRLALTKAWTTRDAFLQFFFSITINFIIQTLLVKTTCN